MAVAVVVMGVSGAGKTTVAKALALELRWMFVEADELHSRANVEKMARGEPLDDADRAPWLAAVAQRIRDVGGDCVVACSALKRSYRTQLEAAAATMRFVLLEAPAELLRKRIEGRKGHFMPAALLESQLATLERTAELMTVDATKSVAELVKEIVAKLAL